MQQKEAEGSYRIPAKTGEAEYTEKKSRFIARCFAVRDEDAALRMLEECRTAHRTARHHVYAYILRENNLVRYSDDGEPQGTAGLPVLDILRHAGISDVLMVVTRYFGGTLLGTGGLVRAYSEAAKLALADSGIAVMERCCRYALRCDYTLYDRLQYLLETHDAVVEQSTFTDNVTLEITLRAARAPALLQDYVALTRGEAAQPMGEHFSAIEIL